jgi:wyosine [tRNA(Phe)-imidazoG37] synthetase (radical SAM superfamily)
LHNRIGWLIRKIKSLTDKPIAVITNGSLLYLPEVREELMIADAILPTLDAGVAKLYRQINRPHPEITFERLVNGLSAFRGTYHGKLWVEVMLVRGLNDSIQALEDLAGILEKIKPDAIHINLPTRPPAETWVQQTENEGLMTALSVLGSVAEVVHPAQGNFDLSGCNNITDTVLQIITRHPMRQEELEDALKQWSPGKVRGVLDNLQSSGKAKVVVRNNVHFWCISSAVYPDDIQSRRTNPSKQRHSIKTGTTSG